MYCLKTAAAGGGSGGNNEWPHGEELVFGARAGQG